MRFLCILTATMCRAAPFVGILIMAEDGTETEKLLKRVQELEATVQRLQERLPESKGATGTGGCLPATGKTKKRQLRPFDFSAYGQRHVALKIAYLGWGYQGFASQENTSNTIEEELFKALSKTRLVESRQTSNYHRCGRTDKGVSAFGQVIPTHVEPPKIPKNPNYLSNQTLAIKQTNLEKSICTVRIQITLY